MIDASKRVALKQDRKQCGLLAGYRAPYPERHRVLKAASTELHGIAAGGERG